ncbi:MAG: M28 family peptidase [Bacteroides sp.]|nr:M28 family peptidase [Bacteroides sp.]
MKNPYILCFITGVICFFSCTGNKSNATVSSSGDTPVVVNVPVFDADSAYQFIQAQVDFGPRVPNTAGHVACGEYLAEKLASFGAAVTDQYADLIAYDGTILKARNIIGSYKPETRKRILLFAHWDTRPWADNDPHKKNHRTPILGANDGASGVGVLLEIARHIGQQSPELGIDIIFFDAEDYGTPQFHTGRYAEDTWALGSQYWSRNPHVHGYTARFGILLDMVGGKNATFYKELYSLQYAPSVVEKVWDTAHRLGYGALFVNEKGGMITDDHYYVNKYIKIPSIDIIPHDHNEGFGSFWHTVDDTMDVIDRSTLKAVGQTVLEVIYREE